MAEEADQSKILKSIHAQLGKFDQSRLAHTQTRITFTDGHQEIEDREVLSNNSVVPYQTDTDKASNEAAGNGDKYNMANQLSLQATMRGTINSASIPAFMSYRTGGIGNFPMNTIEDLQIGRIYDWLLVSSEDVAMKLELLQANKVRRIINLATMCENKFPNDFEYMRVVINDVPTARLSDHFATTFEFIDAARRAGEVCLVHCNAGISRSCSIAIAYSMRHEQLTFTEAFEKVSRARPVCSPNFGFREQLRQLEAQLRNDISLNYPASKNSVAGVTSLPSTEMTTRTDS